MLKLEIARQKKSAILGKSRPECPEKVQVRPAVWKRAVTLIRNEWMDPGSKSKQMRHVLSSSLDREMEGAGHHRAS